MVTDMVGNADETGTGKGAQSSTQARAFGVFITLFNAEQAFKGGAREQGWSLLEHAEQQIPNVEDLRLFRRAQRHADRIWKLACACPVEVDREARTVSFIAAKPDLQTNDILDDLLSDAVVTLGA